MSALLTTPAPAVPSPTLTTQTPAASGRVFPSPIAPRASAIQPGELVRRAPMISAMQAAHWDLDPTLAFLNHGSYGACPRYVLAAQQAIRARMEADPVRFYKVDLENLMDRTRLALGSFLRCDPDLLAPFPNATVALCTALRNFPFKPGDEIITNDHEYMSGTNELDRIAAERSLKVVKPALPYPLPTDPAAAREAIVTAIMSAVTPRTRMVLVSHITSCTSLILPVERLAAECKARGIEILIDGTHAVGQIPVDVASLDPAFYVGSGHKWLSSPKGTGFLYVRRDLAEGFRPLSLSSRAHKLRPERALFLRDFDYVGTCDYSNVLVLPECLEFYATLLPGGWPELLASNHRLIMQGRDTIAQLAGLTPPCPETLIGCMATLIIPEPPAPPSAGIAPRRTLYDDPLQDALLDRHRVVAPVWRLGANGPRVIRFSAQVYNHPEQYAHAGRALAEELSREQALPRG